jgi:hypothetical protein
MRKNKSNLREILGSHGFEYEDDSVLGCYTMSSCRGLPAFEVLSASTVRQMSKPRVLLIFWMMEAASTSETSVICYQTA